MSFPILHGSVAAVEGAFLLQVELYTMRVLQGTELSSSSFLSAFYPRALQLVDCSVLDIVIGSLRDQGAVKNFRVHFPHHDLLPEPLFAFSFTCI
jgi:hypothetical protein